MISESSGKHTSDNKSYAILTKAHFLETVMQAINVLLFNTIYFLFYVILLVLIATSPILFNFLALFMFLIYSGVLRHSEEVALGLRGRAKGKEQIFLFTSKALAVVAAIISTMKFFSL